MANVTLPTDGCEQISEDHETPEGVTRLIGTLIAGTYELLRHIGSGGSSHVFEARHVRLGKLFALKVLRRELSNGRRVAQRFRGEARAIALLRGEHIVSVVDAGELADRTPYLVMELLDGDDLRRLLMRRGRLPVRRAVHLAIEVCRGLVEVHKAGFVHRDLKPENIFIARRSSGEDLCKILDFGVVKTETSQSTAEGAVIGTFRYMAPEQLTEAALVGPATDIYALGAVLYECLAGAPLIAGTTPQEVMFAVINAQPAVIGSLQPHVPMALSQLIEQCVAKSPAKRPQTATELAERLQSSLWAAEPGGTDITIAEESAIRITTATGARKADRALYAVAALLVGAGVGAGWFMRGIDSRASKHPEAGLGRMLSSGSPLPRPAVPEIQHAERGLAVTASPWQAPSVPRTPIDGPPAAKSAGLKPRTELRENRTLAGDRFDQANPYE